jgi:hypothetical protein
MPLRGHALQREIALRHVLLFPPSPAAFERGQRLIVFLTHERGKRIAALFPQIRKAAALKQLQGALVQKDQPLLGAVRKDTDSLRQYIVSLVEAVHRRTFLLFLIIQRESSSQQESPSVSRLNPLTRFPLLFIVS